MADMTNAQTKDRVERVQTEPMRGGVHFTPRVDIYETEGELTLFANGRTGAARVQLSGDDAAINRLRAAKLGF